MATDVQDLTIEEKIGKLRELFADAFVGAARTGDLKSLERLLAARIDIGGSDARLAA